MAVILYIHGFNSGPGGKTEILRREFPKQEVISPQLLNRPLEDIKILQNILDSYEDVRVVGTSLGGFYGLCLAFNNTHRDDLSFYLINPSLIPHDSFSRKLGEKFTNYKNGTEFVVNESFLEELYSLQKKLNSLFRPLPNAYFFLGTKDDVIDHTLLKDTLAYSEIPYNVFESDQDHRHEDIREVMERIKENMVL
jgi:uncharacterized protein